MDWELVGGVAIVALAIAAVVLLLIVTSDPAAEPTGTTYVGR